MGIKKQPDPKSATLSEGAYDWFRNFLKLLEIYMSETGQGLPSDPSMQDVSLATIRAVKLTLQDSGLTEDQISVRGKSRCETNYRATRPELSQVSKVASHVDADSRLGK